MQRGCQAAVASGRSAEIPEIVKASEVAGYSMSVVSRMVERHRDTTFDKERLHADIAASWIVRSLQLCHWSETVRRAHA